MGYGIGYRKGGTLGGLASWGSSAVVGMMGMCKVLMTLVVQEGGLDRDNVLFFARNAPRVPYGEMVNA